MGPAQRCFTNKRPGDAHDAGVRTTPGVQAALGCTHKVEVWEGGWGQAGPWWPRGKAFSAHKPPQIPMSLGQKNLQ